MLTLSEISKLTKISENYLKQLAAALEKKGILKGKKGPNGGYIILNDKVSLMDLIEIFSGGVQLAPCIGEQYKCELINSCRAHGTWLKLNTQISELFKNITLKDF